MSSGKVPRLFLDFNSNVCFVSHSYNFFLDEVLNVRNVIRTEELERQGYRPRLMREDELRIERERPQLSM